MAGVVGDETHFDGLMMFLVEKSLVRGVCCSTGLVEKLKMNDLWRGEVFPVQPEDVCRREPAGRSDEDKGISIIVIGLFSVVQLWIHFKTHCCMLAARVPLFGCQIRRVPAEALVTMNALF